MYALALALSAATTASTTGLPFIHMGELNVGVPLQSFGIIVALGVLIGAELLRRYAEWHGLSDDHIRGLLGWVTVTGFIGAHVLDVLMYEPEKIGSMSQWGLWPTKWPGLLRIWDGISSYGGFVGGAIGFFIYVWWKRLPARLMADITIVGLLPAFSIGRIGCTVVSDHIGGVADPNGPFAWLAMEYPRTFNTQVIRDLAATHPGTGPILAWNLGLVELLYLIPVNALLLYLAFRKKRLPAGFLVAMTGILYPPVRFFLDTMRPPSTDRLHGPFTFAQWGSILAMGAAVALAAKLIKDGKAAEVVAPTAREAHARLKLVDAETEKEAEKMIKDKATEAKPKARGTNAAEAEKKQTAKTEYTGNADAPSPNVEEPADEGAKVEEEKDEEKKDED